MRAKQEDAKLTSPYEHIKNTSTCRAILTENKLETGRKTHTNKIVRKIHVELGRKGREAIRLIGTCALQRGHRRGGFHGLGNPSWGVV